MASTRLKILFEAYEQNTITSPSGAKLKAEITVVTAISDVPDSKFGRPGGPLASKTFIFVTLTLENNDRLSIPTNKSMYQARGVKKKYKDNSSSTFQKKYIKQEWQKFTTLSNTHILQITV